MTDNSVDFSKFRVLAVEDYMMNQEVLESIFDDLGCDYEILDNYTEALKLHEQKPFDIIFMDIFVPDMDGYLAANKIRKMQGKAGQTPLVAVTANAMPEDREKCLKAGMNEYLAKPIKKSDLAEMFVKFKQN